MNKNMSKENYKMLFRDLAIFASVSGGLTLLKLLGIVSISWKSIMCGFLIPTGIALFVFGTMYLITKK